MSIFREMHEQRIFNSWRDFHEVERMLSESIERGYVREINPGLVLWNGKRVVQRQVTIAGLTFMDPRCYEELETGVIYILVSPDGDRLPGCWEPVYAADSGAAV